VERKFDATLLSWKEKNRRKPLLLRGARQTGKTHAVRKLGKTFDTFVEINFEREPRFCSLFEQDLEPDRILRQISALRQADIPVGRSLLFFDEIQSCPKAVTALRYFYESIPGMHVIGAGSLLEFELASVSVPVGRIEYMFVRPLTFDEFLHAVDRH
jgi:uncharacterized protein